MAVFVSAAGSNSRTGNHELTISGLDLSSAGSNRALYVFTCARHSAGAPDVTSATWNTSESLTDLGNNYRQTGESNTMYIETWRLTNPSAVSANVVVEWDSGVGNFDELWITAIAVEGADQTDPDPDASAQTAIGTGTGITDDVTSESGELVIGAVFTFGGAITVGSGQTERSQIVIGGDACFGTSTEGGAATVTMSWTGNSGEPWYTLHFPVEAAAVSGIAAPVAYHHRARSWRKV